MFAFPNLRFPGFEEEWETKKLGEVVKINQGLQIAISERLTEKREGAYFYITNEFLKANSIKRYYILNPPKSVICEEEDILMTRTGNTGQVVTNVSGAFHNNFFKVAYPEYIVKNFLLNFLQSNKIQNQIIRLAGTSTIPDLNHSDFYKIKIIFPSTQEQKKISTLLSLLAQRIQTQKKIISQLTSQMLNLKDLIFEQKLKFKDDQDANFPDWKENKIENICEKQSSSISANKIEDNIGDYPIYGATGILKNIDFYEVESDYISIIKDGAGVGRLLYCKGKSSVLGTLDIIKPKNVNIFFLYLLLSRIDFKKYITGSTIPHIYFKDYKKEKHLIPSIEEQFKIANFLSSIQEKIEIQKQILEKLEFQKKFLLANLFV
ncbi:restriction endonuclease subunit S [Chryseobacterium tructae]|uniref:Restriction endonuclease subunit S n=1 Tax=Chryseobacterium tructae TaxID=1037380 RepID=A0ABV7XVY6_9FLAO|nr:restriction endonuclease subunit S [Chryseobacterium tructae]MDN3692105.1 restriction endonuclease subunit S [Chryseobacterium tructae]